MMIMMIMMMMMMPIITINPLSKRGNPKQDMTRAGLIYQSDWRKIFYATWVFSPH